MNIRLGGKLLAALTAAVFTSGAQAAIDDDQIIFYAYNGTTNSVLFDLGINMSNFATGNNSTIVWNLRDSTVTSNTPGGTTVSYGSIWSGSAFSFAEGTTRWGVVGANATLGDVVTTTLAPLATVQSFTEAGLTQASAQIPATYWFAANGLGNHSSVANGANFASGVSNANHSNGFLAADRWRNQAPFQAGRTGSGALPFYYIAYNDPFGNVTPYAGRFSFDAATATLTYAPTTVGEIPEPSALGLVAAGALGLVGFARRRKQA